MKNNDIVLVPFPFSDLLRDKLRPALVIASTKHNLIVCQISTKLRSSPYEIPLHRTDCKGDIRFDGQINTDMIFTLHKDLVIKKIGNVKSETTKKHITKKLAQLFKI